MAKIILQELSSPGCSHCAAFRQFWHSIEKDYPDVEFQDISVITPEGQELAQKHMIFSSPGIIINGELFSTGGVDKDKFIAKLKEFLI
jgi:thioredoxin 1